MMFAAVSRCGIFASICCAVLITGCAPDPTWSRYERQVMASMQLQKLPAAEDLSNGALTLPGVAELGRAIFHDTRFSANGRVSCATCHRPDYFFADDQPLSTGIGTTGRHTPSLLGAAHGRWFYWDGRRDSLWAQALTPLEHPDEHGFSRVLAVNLIAADPAYRKLYAATFGTLPDMQDLDNTFANIGKAIAAFEHTLQPGTSRFDQYVAALLNPAAETHSLFTADEILGLRLFIGKGQCISCHNGPLFTNQSFQNIGTGSSSDNRSADLGRRAGLPQLRADPFNCLQRHSDAPAAWCALNFARTEGAQLAGAFKVPGLRNVAATPPYMHDGRFNSLEEVVEHYVQAAGPRMLSRPGQPPVPSHSEIVPLALTDAEQSALVAFLGTLTQLEP